MAGEYRAWTRQGEAFWRAHHEAWKRSDLNQREYCEGHGLPPKAFENWRACEVQNRAAAARAQAPLPSSPLKSSPKSGDISCSRSEHPIVPRPA